MRIIDLSEEMMRSFEEDHFCMELWKSCMDKTIPGAKELCIEDMQETVKAGFPWETAFLPVLNAVLHDTEKRERSIASFRKVTQDLNERIIRRFHQSPDIDLILYLGLCNGAGWVTSVNGKEVILFGIEKIMELGWDDEDSMAGLVWHELGHVYHHQYGRIYEGFDTSADRFLWQLFSEGIAMVFEQELAGDPEYFNQDRDGWKQWCDQNADLIRQSFRGDLLTMTPENQRYFGDWADFCGHGDTGYYLGARFIRFLLRDDPFDRIIQYDMPKVKACFARFLNE